MDPDSCAAFPGGNPGTGRWSATTPCYDNNNHCYPLPGTPATTYGDYWTAYDDYRGRTATFHTNVTKHCCPAETPSPSQPAKAGTAVSVAATTEDAYPIMYMLACVSTQSAGQLRATEGHQHD
jgi:hypothetical protein